MNTDLLISLIRKHGLAKHQVAILETAQPAVYIGLEGAGIGEVGQSRMGGLPDLPSSMSWPKSSDGDAYLCFILQINLAQLPSFASSPLPSQGMLYLFMNEGENAAEQIIFWNGTEPLRPVPQPDPEEMITDWYEGLKPHMLLFELLPDIPRWATDDFYKLCNDFEIDEEPLDEIGRDLSRSLSQNLSKRCVGKLLGHAAGIGYDPRQDAYVVREVNPEWLYNYEKRKTLDMSNAQRWRNLLFVDSNDQTDLWFGDAGYLQVLVHENDLAQMDLSRAYVTLESS